MTISKYFKNNDLIVLLGAGASFDAGIPHSTEMIKRIEGLINNPSDQDWCKFKKLYDYVRSSIYHSDGIRGKFDKDVIYNIERLVNTLDELSKKKEHTLYPFVGSWNPTLIDVAGDDFKLVDQFKKAILGLLRRDWIILKDKTKADYYRELINLQKDYGYPLRVFSLNYDLCVELVCQNGDYYSVERGFSRDTRKWDWREFESNESITKSIYLYKLHGSNDWTYDIQEDLTFLDDPGPINDEKAALIFGTTYKLQYRDPFLFLAYEFRRWSLEASLIVSIGYGFGDEHVNKIIHQALNDKTKRHMLLSVAPFGDRSEEEVKNDVLHKLEHKDRSQISCVNASAMQFMQNSLTKDYLLDYLPYTEADLFAEI